MLGKGRGLSAIKGSGDDLKDGDAGRDQFTGKGKDVISGSAERGAGAQFDNVGLHDGI